MELRRVAVLGSPGSGKSTVARALGARLGLPVTHLDRLYWNAGWVECTDDEFRRRHRAVVEQDEWVIDGNYTQVGKEERLERADLVVALEIPRWRCMWRVARRSIVLHGRSRPDMPEGCPERFSFSFLAWVWNWHRRHPHLAEELMRLAPGKRVVSLHTQREIETFLAG